MLNTVQRRKKLYRSKFFHCNCSRCQDPTELGTYMGALKCPKCTTSPERGYLLIDSRHDDYKCDTCNFVTSSDKADRLVEAVVNAQAKRNVRHPEKLESLLRSHEKKLHPRNAVLLNFKNEGLMASYARLRTLQSVERRLEIMRERKEVCLSVDKGDSRLLGFLCFKLHCLLIEKAMTMQRQQLTPMAGQLVKEMEGNLKTATRILIEDSGCPDEVRKAVFYEGINCKKTMDPLISRRRRSGHEVHCGEATC